MALQTAQQNTQLASTELCRPSMSTHSFCGLAKPIFDFVEHCETSNTGNPKQAEQLLDNFLVECHKANYHHESSLLAQFILARFIDTALSGQNAASQTLSKSEDFSNRFQDILNAMLKMPDAFIDVLELLWLCSKLSGKTGLIQTADHKQLYHVIRSTRGEYDFRLSKVKPEKKQRTLAQQAHLAIAMTIVMTLVIIGASFASFDIVLKKSEAPLQQKLKQLTHALDIHG